MTAHEAVRDQESDGLGDIIRPADATNRRAPGKILEHSLTLFGGQEIPPRRIDHSRRNAIHAQWLQLGSKHPHHRLNPRIDGGKACGPRHRGLRTNGGHESNATVWPQERQSRLRRRSMRDELRLEARKEVGHVKRREGTGAMTAAQRQHEMIEGSKTFEGLLHGGGISGIDGNQSDLAGKIISRCLELRLVPCSDGDPKSLFQKQSRRGKADTRRAADNNCVLQ